MTARRNRQSQRRARHLRSQPEEKRRAPRLKPPSTVACPLGLLASLGIYGLEAIELPLIAGLVIGEPILLVGGHGCGKTTLCRTLADALGLSFWAYDASKSLFEDVIGFPNPEQLGKGVLDYVPTALSIWGREGLLIDELSRATPAMQSKWLEVIRSRRIMGKRLDDLRQVFAAMNPPTYLGAFPLDEAMAGRFTVVIEVPPAHELDDDALRAVIQNVTQDDLGGLNAEGALQIEETASLVSCLEGARRRYRRTPKRVREQIVEYVLGLARSLSDRDVQLDSRRLGMLQRLLLAALALDANRRGRRHPLAASRELLWQVLCGGLPFVATGQEVAEPLLRCAHELALARAMGEECGNLNWLPADPLLRACALIRCADAEVSQRSAALTRCLESVEQGDADGRERGVRGLGVLARALGTGALTLPADDTFRLLDSFRSSLAIPPTGQESALAALRFAFEHRWWQGAAAENLPLALRLACGALGGDEDDFLDPNALAARLMQGEAS